jgi:hypothetical protein
MPDTGDVCPDGACAFFEVLGGSPTSNEDFRHSLQNPHKVTTPVGLSKWKSADHEGIIVTAGPTNRQLA